MFSWTGLFMIAVSCGVLYYGWPVIEAILIMLPIPDPKNVKEKTIAIGCWSYDKRTVGRMHGKWKCAR